MLSLLYRGRLASCNYDCPYCPFAKRKDDRATLKQDAAELARFVDWLRGQPEGCFSLLFTPWGEALTRRHYRDAIITLSHLPQVARVAVQTNLSNSPQWLAAANPDRVSLWCSFHPEETPRAGFLQRVQQLQALGVRHSIGMVGIRRFFGEMAALRQQLPPDTYLWINAYHDEGRRYYSAAELAWLGQIDPWFALNHQAPPSLGAPCVTGERVLSVDGNGDIRRCHFVPAVLGNLYQPALADPLQTRACPNRRCDCYIGHAHRPDLPFQQAFGLGTLGRIPEVFHWQAPADWQPVPPAPPSSSSRVIRLVAH